MKTSTALVVCALFAMPAAAQSPPFSQARSFAIPEADPMEVLVLNRSTDTVSAERLLLIRSRSAAASRASMGQAYWGEARYQVDLIQAAVDSLGREIKLAKKEKRDADRETLKASRDQLKARKKLFERRRELRRAQLELAIAETEYADVAVQALELEEQLMKKRATDVVDQSLIDLERETLLMRRDGEKYRKRVADRHEKVVDRQLALLEMQLKINPNGSALASR